MAAAADNSWMPSGRHQVHLGASLARTLKARQSANGPIKSTKPKAEREFYSFRYNFKPESIDVTRSGTIETRRPKEEGGPSTVTVVRPSQQNDTGISFVGTENVAREFECVLVYDEGTGTITLEKLDSLITLNHDPKPTLAPRHLGSPAPAPPPRASGSSSATSSHAHQSAVKQEEEESEVEIPETKPEPKPEPMAKSRPAAISKVKSRPQPRPAAGPSASASMPASTTTSAAATPAPSASTNSRPAHGLPPRPTPPVAPPKGKAPAASSQMPSIPAKSPNKRERPVEPEEETLEIRRPQPVLKKAKLAKREPPKQQPPPPPPKPVALSFPDSSSAVSLPPAPLSAAAPVLAVPDPIAAVSSVVPANSDDEWEDLVPAVAASPVPVPVPAPVTAAAAAPPSGPSRTIIMEEIDEYTPPPRQVELPTMAMAGDEADAEGDEDLASEMERAMLAHELEGELETMEQDEYLSETNDFLEAAISPVEERKPMSLSEWAASGTAGLFEEDDDYSSSDDSEDE